VKVAQYEVLGMKQKDTSVPRGTIETIGFWSRTRLNYCQHPSIVPFGTDSFLKTVTQPRTGLLSSGPCGTDFS